MGDTVSGSSYTLKFYIRAQQVPSQYTIYYNDARVQTGVAVISDNYSAVTVPIMTTGTSSEIVLQIMAVNSLYASIISIDDVTFTLNS